MRRAASLVIFAFVLSCAPLVAVAQATKPALPADPNRDMPLPPRRGGVATTQGSAGAAVGGSGDVFDNKRLALALGIVLIAIFVSHNVWKRLGMPGAAGRASGSLQVVSRLNVAPKQQLMLVRVGRRLVLVGNSGTQMNSLCEIADPEEAAALLGQTATEREGSLTSSFNAVLGGEEKRFEEQQTNVDLPAGEGASEPDPTLATTREEISGLMEKVRSMSNQFRRS